MKDIVFICLLCLSITGCSQNKNSNNAKHKIEMDSLKKFNYESQYRLKISSGLSYEVRINDIPIAVRNNTGFQTIWFPINNTICKTGTQSIEINVFPKLVKSGEKYENFIENNNEFELIIEQTAWDNTGTLETPKEILRYLLPNKDYSKISTHKDILSFNAEIPYQLIDWNEGKIFKEEDSIMLRAKIFNFYKDLKYLYENQKGEEYISKTSKGLFNLYQASYFDKKEAMDYVTSTKEFINEEPTKLEPLENYKLIICGEGKLIGLKRIDGYNNNEGVFRRIYNNGGMKEVQIDDILLYQPIGKDDLEIIWYMNYVKPADL